jgi:hypothetical protein
MTPISWGHSGWSARLAVPPLVSRPGTAVAVDADRSSSLFNDLVSNSEHARRNGEVERPGRFEINHQLELAR